MNHLKLKAADMEDLEILSARLQDAAGKLGDFLWLSKERRFAVQLNRFRWEAGDDTRVQAVLRFDSVIRAQSQNIKLGAPDAVVALLAIRFTPKGEGDPAGVIELLLAGGGAFRLEVECIDAELADLSQPWAACGRPSHEGEG